MKYHIPIAEDPVGGRERAVPIGHRGVTILAAIFWTLIVVSGGVYATWYLQAHKRGALAALPAGAAEGSSDTYIAAIAKKILLPKDRTAPRVAVIIDPSLLTLEQDFYRGAEVGDVLVIFEESKRAILYSPRRDIIVNVGPIVPRDLSMNTTDRSSAEGDSNNQ
jgi:hypothetical protein